MQCIKRFKDLRDDSLDNIMLQIKQGKLKCGRYAHRIKIKKDFKVGKVLFKDDTSKDSNE